ncbi:probable cytochrome P450 6a17 [Anthonomus grandis grandis]|uniref:probable cytochrome P450 6a17 n=1 Tax=Anthonomus grandis grandis TaxID=2921223 RepID=UPI0021651B05|nr:probable cytochrome P450 6a17 [Anthonomus grandis grandis]
MVYWTSVTLFIGLAFTLLFMLLNYIHQYWKRKGIPQLEPIHLIFGNYKPMVTGETSLQNFFLDLYRKVKVLGYPYMGLYNMCYPTLMPVNLELIKRILSKDYNYFDSHGFYSHKSDVFSMNLFNIEGNVWKNRRTKMTPAFSSGKIKLMLETLLEKASQLTNVLKNVADSKKPIDLKDILLRYSTDVIGNVAFGLNVDTLTDPSDKFSELGKKALKPSLIKMAIETILPHNLLRLLRYQTTPKDVREYFIKVVLDTMNFRTKHNIERNDFMQMMIQLNKTGSLNADPSKTDSKLSLTIDEVISESFLIYLAGHETSASTSTFACFELAQPQNHYIQEKLREEILESLKKHNEKLTYEGITEMEYLDKVVRETLRKYPVVSILPRVCSRDYVIPNTNIVIKKGTNIPIPVIGIHMDEEYYPSPEVFNPENFSKENVASRPDFAWLPFGDGPRQCLGMRFGYLQVKVVIATLLSKFRFTLDESMKPPYEADRGSLVYMFKNPVMLKVTNV